MEDQVNSTTIRIKQNTKDRLERIFHRLKENKKVKDYDGVINYFMDKIFKSHVKETKIGKEIN